MHCIVTPTDGQSKPPNIQAAVDSINMIRAEVERLRALLVTDPGLRSKADQIEIDALDILLQVKRLGVQSCD